MEILEKQNVTEFKNVIIAHKCDVCGKTNSGEYTPNDWHTFSHNHNEWGNDSCESYEYHEVCSPECYWIKFEYCVKDLKDRKSAKIDEYDIAFAIKLLKLKTE